MPTQGTSGVQPLPTRQSDQSAKTSRSVVAADIAQIIAADVPWETLAGKTVLVTGASGMIPAYVVRTLLALNDARSLDITVLGLVRSSDKARVTLGAAFERADFIAIEADVTKARAVDRHVDVVVHGASPARPSLHAHNPVDTIRANVQGAFAMLDLCVESGNAHFVLMSSAEVYGHQADNETLISEDSYGSLDILNPRACYSEGKRAAETIAVSYRAQHGVPVTIARFGHVYGPGMALDDGRVQADFTSDVIAGRDITLNSDGSARRTYTYLSDAVCGMFFALLMGTQTAYNIADADGFVTIRELAQAFVAARPLKRLSVRFGDGIDPTAVSPVKAAGLDDSRLRGLGWQPRVDLPTGIDRTIAWHEERIA